MRTVALSLLVFVSLLAPGGLAAADDKERDDVVRDATRVGSGVTIPVLIHKVNPKYTSEARDARIEGVTVLSAEVWPDGATHNIRVVRRLDPGLDQEAIKAATKWRFRPGTKDGVPVKVAVTLEVNFRLR
jgi:TonB family protein